MPVKKLDDVSEGDVLAQDLTNTSGVALVNAGVALTEKHIRMLKMWGIAAVTVRAPDQAFDQDRAAGPTDELLDQVEATIRARFGPSLDNEIMAEILRVAVEQRAAALLSARDDRRG